MPWRVLHILFAALSLPWAFVATAILLSAGAYIDKPGMLRAKEQAFEAVGVMRRTGKPVIAMLHLSNAENLNLGHPFATVVKRKEVSFDPADVQKALPQADKEFWTYGGENFVEVRVLDANADGQLDVLFQYDFDTLVEPTAHICYLYTVADNTPVLLLAVHGEADPLEPVKTKDGTYAFINRRTVWQNKAYVWKGGRYRLLDYNVREQRKQILLRFAGAPLAFGLWIWLISLAPAAWLFSNGWIYVGHPMQKREKPPIGKGYYLLLWCWVIGFAVAAWLIIYPRFYHVSYMLSLILFLPSWLAGLGAAIAQTVLGVRYNRTRGDSNGSSPGEIGGRSLPGVGR